MSTKFLVLSIGIAFLLLTGCSSNNINKQNPDISNTTPKAVEPSVVQTPVKSKKNITCEEILSPDFFKDTCGITKEVKYKKDPNFFFTCTIKVEGETAYSFGYEYYTGSMEAWKTRVYNPNAPNSIILIGDKKAVEQKVEFDGERDGYYLLDFESGNKKYIWRAFTHAIWEEFKPTGDLYCSTEQSKKLATHLMPIDIQE